MNLLYIFVNFRTISTDYSKYGTHIQVTYTDNCFILLHSVRTYCYNKNCTLHSRHTYLNNNGLNVTHIFFFQTKQLSRSRFKTNLALNLLFLLYRNDPVTICFSFDSIDSDEKLWNKKDF